MSTASPLPHPATPLLTRLADPSFKLASSGRPCGPAHNALRTRAYRYAARVSVVTPSAPPPLLGHISFTVPTARSHSHCPLARSPKDHVPVRFLASVTVHRSMPPALARRLCPQMFPRPGHCSAVPSPHHDSSHLVVTFPFPPHVSPGHDLLP
jgi:hypothetical protein